MRTSVRQMGLADRGTWIRLRAALWPHEIDEVHGKDVDAMLGTEAGFGFIAETEDASAVGFAEISIRPFANGCDNRPVPFLEGIWVEPPFRRRGIGGLLIKHIEAFVMARGFPENRLRRSHRKSRVPRRPPRLGLCRNGTGGLLPQIARRSVVTPR